MDYSTIRDNHTNGTVGYYLKDGLTPEPDVSIVLAYFTINAYHMLRDSLESLQGLHFLFGEPTFIKTRRRYSPILLPTTTISRTPTSRSWWSFVRRMR